MTEVEKLAFKIADAGAHTILASECLSLDWRKGWFDLDTPGEHQREVDDAARYLYLRGRLRHHRTDISKVRFVKAPRKGGKK